MPAEITFADLPAAFRPLVQKAEAAMTAKNYEYVVQLMLPVVKSQPHYLEGRKLLRRSATMQKKGGALKKLFGGLGSGMTAIKWKSKVEKDPQSTIHEIEDALVQDPYDIPTNLALHTACVALEMPETALFALETLREGHPKNNETLHLLAQYHITLGQSDQAVQVYQHIMNVDPSDIEARRGFTNANARSSIVKQGWGKKESVRDMLQDQEVARELEAEARVGMSVEQLHERIGEWSRRYEATPQDFQIARRLGELYEQLADYQTAAQWYAYSSSLRPDDVALAGYAQQVAQRAAGQAVATPSSIPVTSLAPASPPTMVLPPATANDAGSLSPQESAIAVAKSRVENNPTDLTLRYALGQAYLQAEKYGDAIPELQRSKNSAALRTRTLCLLAQCYMHRGVDDLAVRSYQEAIGEIVIMDDLKKEALYDCGLLLEKMGRISESLDHLKQIYEYDYGYRDVADRVEKAYSSSANG
jgi:tetratricopeptide (TPR) repeat protein